MVLGQACYTLLIILLLLAGCRTLELQPQQKINISIYYESLCPDSKLFITQYFYPAYEIFSNYLNIRFIPFGKANIREDGSEYTCQHGKEECVRNIIHGCALDMLTSTNQVEFVYCAMIKRTIMGHKECAIQNGLIWEDIQNCVNGERGLALTLLAQYDTRISTDGPKFVPTIIFNNKFSQENQKLTFRDPISVICKYLAFHPQCDEPI
ncbi:hypothetical protein PGB90_000310 [Kerria lacca]